MKRAAAHFESIRRPSGDADTSEWQLLVTELEIRVQKLENSKEQLTRKNDILSSKLKEYSDCLKSATSKFRVIDISTKLSPLYANM